MTKIQKVWLWIFGAMFIVPEILFWFIILSISNFLGKDFNSIYSLGIKNGLLPNNSLYLFIVLIIELIGVFGLLIIALKFNKKILAVLLTILLAWLLFVFFYLYAVSNMGF